MVGVEGPGLNGRHGGDPPRSIFAHQPAIDQTGQPRARGPGRQADDGGNPTGGDLLEDRLGRRGR